MNLVDIKTEKLTNILAAKAVLQGYSKSEASLIAHEFVLNEAIGKKPFGLISFTRLMSYDKRKRKSNPKIITNGNVTIIDCGGRFAHIFLPEILKKVKKKRVACGIQLFAIKNNTTFLRAGYPIQAITEAGFVGICIIYSGANVVTTKNIQKPIFGTNPLSIGIPYGNKSIIYDTSSSSVSWGKLKELKKASFEESNFALGLDPKGEYTNKAAEVVNLIPMAGNKGLGLSLCIEILAGGLLGYEIGNEKSEYNADNGILIITIDPSKLTDMKGFESKVKGLIGDVKTFSNGKQHIPGENYFGFKSVPKKLSVDKNILDGIISYGA